MEISGFNNQYKTSKEVIEEPSSATIRTGMSNSKDKAPKTDYSEKRVTDTETPKNFWHVNLPLKSKAAVMMIQAQMLQNQGDEKTISEVISEAIDFYHRHIFNL